MRRQVRTPRLRARAGKRRNWKRVEAMAKMVKMAPMRRESMPKPPENLKGRVTDGELRSWGGW